MCLVRRDVVLDAIRISFADPVPCRVIELDIRWAAGSEVWVMGIHNFGLTASQHRSVAQTIASWRVVADTASVQLVAVVVCDWNFLAPSEGYANPKAPEEAPRVPAEMRSGQRVLGASLMRRSSCGSLLRRTSLAKTPRLVLIGCTRALLHGHCWPGVSRSSASSRLPISSGRVCRTMRPSKCGSARECLAVMALSPPLFCARRSTRRRRRRCWRLWSASSTRRRRCCLQSGHETPPVLFARDVAILAQA